MDRENPNESTPNSKLSDPLERTGQKLSQKEALVESKYELQDGTQGQHEGQEDNAHQESESRNRLDEIESEIRSIARRLEEIRLEQLKETDPTSDVFLDLEEERSNLRKKLIDLDYAHRVECANSIRESRRRAEEQKEREIREAEEHRERRLREIEEEFAERKRRIEEEDEKRRNQNEAQETAEQAQQEEGQEQGQQDPVESEIKEAENSLEKSRRLLRIAEIENELAQESLRRSRRLALDTELSYLRATYGYPYYSWRDYYPYTYPSYPSVYSSPYYPLGASYLYPSSYVYPSSYLYSHRYRWI